MLHFQKEVSFQASFAHLGTVKSRGKTPCAQNIFFPSSPVCTGMQLHDSKGGKEMILDKLQLL